MNIYEAVEALIALQKKSISYLMDTMSYKTEIANILQELLDSGGVGEEYKTPIIQVPGVKELAEKSYREGVDDSLRELAGLPIKQTQIDNMVYEHLRTLEDKNE